MTVYRLGGRKARITLSDSEVRSFFGEYASLRAVTGEVKMTLALILEESLPDYGDSAGDLIVEVRAKENSGCVITVTAAGQTAVTIAAEDVAMALATRTIAARPIARKATMRPTAAIRRTSVPRSKNDGMPARHIRKVFGKS